MSRRRRQKEKRGLSWILNLIKNIFLGIGVLAVVFVVLGLLGVWDKDETESTAMNEATQVESSQAPDPVESVEESSEQKEESSSIEESEIEEENTKVTVNVHKEVQFGEYHTDVQQLAFYEEDGAQLVDVSMRWTNQSGEDERTFFALGLLSVYQGDKYLEEVSGAMDNYTSRSNYFYKADNMISAPLDLTFELVSDEPVELRFTSTNLYVDEEEQVITVETP